MSAGELNPLFPELAQLLGPADPNGNDDMCLRLCITAARVVPGCHHASLMRVRDGKAETIAASDEVALMIDDAERASGEGPCLDAITEESGQLSTDLCTDTSWPTLSAWIVANTPVRSALAFRLVMGGQKVGALNLFSDLREGITAASVNHAAIFAAFAAAAVNSAYERRRADDLAAGLHSNREIGKAVGLLMAFHKIDDNQAFAILRHTSQDLNIKVAHVAEEIVEHHRRR